MNAREQTKWWSTPTINAVLQRGRNRYLFINIKNDDANLGMLLVRLDDILIASINHGKVNIYFDNCCSTTTTSIALALCELNSFTHSFSVSLSTFFVVCSVKLLAVTIEIDFRARESHYWRFLVKSFTLSHSLCQSAPVTLIPENENIIIILIIAHNGFCSCTHFTIV